MEGCAIAVVAGSGLCAVGTLGFGCPAAVAGGETILVGCAEAYAACIGYCNIPSGSRLLVVTAVQRFADFQTLLRVQDPVAVTWVRTV